MKSNELEIEAVRRFLTNEAASSINVENEADKALFALVAAMELLAKARDARFRHTNRPVDSARRDLVTTQSEIRNHLVEVMKEAMPNVSLLAEDATAIPTEGEVAVLDAIDGTKNFMTHGEANAVTFSLFSGGKPTVSFVANPSTGEIAYARESEARLIQLPLRGDEARAVSLPFTTVSDEKPLLISVHAYRNVSGFLEQFFGAWSQSHYDIELIKAYSGSPSWAMIEAAKGHFVYANIWDQAEAMPQDLVSALHILRVAGGDAVRANGEAIPAVGHRGAFIAGAHEFDRTPVIEIINVVKANADLAEGLI